MCSAEAGEPSCQITRANRLKGRFVDSSNMRSIRLGCGSSRMMGSSAEEEGMVRFARGAVYPKLPGIWREHMRPFVAFRPASEIKGRKPSLAPTSGEIDLLATNAEA